VVAAVRILAVIIVLAVIAVVLLPRLAGLGRPSVAVPAPDWAPPVAAVAPTPAASVTSAGIVGLVDPRWAASAAAATGIPERAVLAYAGASLLKASSAPSCRLSWTTLAAIGEAESDHGRHGGSSIGADGTVTPPIYGVALNGDGVALVPDSDGGAIDQDAAADRAVGPMQLIPQTWRNWHTDGNVVATSNYLCRASGGLDTQPGWRAAISAYNSAPSYLDKVATFAVRYNRLVAGAR
jgi:membrane-bound lytic murein transglycosylase B